NGNVVSARAVSGKPPFAELAVEAARRWTFMPARRAGRAVGSRFLFNVDFEPPPAETPNAPEAQPKPAAKQRAAPVLEVVVQGERPPKPPPGTVVITREEAQALPGTFGDPLRAIEAQPGVVPIVSGLPSYFIRGAPPGNVGFVIDGVDIPLLFHAFFGPSVIQPGFIQGVDFYKGAAPVEFGRVAGPVVSTTLTPLTHRFTGEASVRTIDAGGMVEVPFGACPTEGKPNCSLGSVRLGGRYAYAGLILAQLGDAKLDYWDYQSQATIELGRHDSLGLLAFGAYDYFDAGPSSDQGGGDIHFHRADLRWDHAEGGTHLRVGLTGGYDSTGGVEQTTSTVSDRSVRLRGDLSSDLSEAATLHVGLDGRIDDFKLETDPLLLNFADYSALLPTRTQETIGGYTSVELRPTKRITVVPGIRADMYWDRGKTANGVDPRISAEFAVSDAVLLDDTFGISHQLPNFIPNVPAAQVADLGHGLQEAVQWSSGVHVKLPADIKASATVFRAGYFNAIDPLGGKRDFSIDRTAINVRYTIASEGIEFLLERSLTKKLGGFLAYTLSHTQESSGTLSEVSGFDRPHVVQAALGYDFGRGWTASTRAVFYSGVPELNLQQTPHFTTERRGRPYFRVDLRAEKRWRLGRTTWWSIVAEILNATSTTEVVRLDCGDRCAERVAGPVILPSVGIQAGF
ncbi:MAG TPA: TonB-dependent receptor, partial [Polyangiaceae bacterium]|nr:TonB-dependent receptor [Polyangiaceae bacterium]